MTTDSSAPTTRNVILNCLSIRGCWYSWKYQMVYLIFKNWWIDDL